jgi:hypothetical protein
LTDLSVSEISLVDRPSNPGAWIALRKADGSQDTYRRVRKDGLTLFEKQSKPGGVDELALPIYPRHQDPAYQPITRPTKGENMPITTNPTTKRKKKFSTMVEAVSKGDPNFSLAEQESIVLRKARKIAAKTGKPVQKVESELWTDLHQRNLIARDNPDSRTTIAKRDPQLEFARVVKTAAEVRIDKYAAQIQKRDGCSIAQALNKAWLEHTDLYAAYIEQYNAPEFQEKIQKAAMRESIKTKDDPAASIFDDDEEDDGDQEDDGEDGEKDKSKRKQAGCKCGKCNKVYKADMNFCPACGARLPK